MCSLVFGSDTEAARFVFYASGRCRQNTAASLVNPNKRGRTYYWILGGVAAVVAARWLEDGWWPHCWEGFCVCVCVWTCKNGTKMGLLGNPPHWSGFLKRLSGRNNKKTLFSPAQTACSWSRFKIFIRRTLNPQTASLLCCSFVCFLIFYSVVSIKKCLDLFYTNVGILNQQTI